MINLIILMNVVKIIINNMENSKLYNVNIIDVAKGLLLSVVSAVGSYFFSGGKMTAANVGTVAASVAIPYIIGQFGVNSQGKILKAEQVVETVLPMVTNTIKEHGMTSLQGGVITNATPNA